MTTTILTIGTSHVQSGHDSIALTQQLRSTSIKQQQRTGLSTVRNSNVQALFDQTWPGYLEQCIPNSEVINLGVSGVGIEGFWERTIHALDEYTPDVVVLEIPSATRYTIWPEDPIEYTTPLQTISHIHTRTEFHYCENVQPTNTIFPESQSHRYETDYFGDNTSFVEWKQAWLRTANPAKIQTHWNAYSVLQGFIERVAPVVPVLFNSDSSTLDSSINKNVPRSVWQILKTQKPNGPTYSSDGSGHLSFESERWWVDNVLLNQVEKIIEKK
jgi:hypothetical protein